MKNLFFITAVLFTAVALSACSDDEDKVLPSSKNVKSVEIVDNGTKEKKIIEYDAQNRVIRFGDAQFTYEGNKLTVNSPNERIVATLNSDGYITSGTLSFSYEDKTYCTSTFTYDKNGFLSKAVDYDAYGSQDEYTYTWENGNLTQITVKYYKEDDSDKIMYSYGSAIATMNLDLIYYNDETGNELSCHCGLGLLGLLGRRSSHLPTGWKDNIKVNTSIEYQFDNEGNVVRMDEIGENYSLTFTY